MEASLDTNVIIHLYRANLQAILFKRFKGLKVYEFIRAKECVLQSLRAYILLYDIAYNFKNIYNGKYNNDSLVSQMTYL